MGIKKEYKVILFEIAGKKIGEFLSIRSKFKPNNS